MQVRRLSIPDVLLIEPTRHGDERGWFEESYNKMTLSPYLGGMEFLQDNHVKSSQKLTLRGLHFQNPPFAQAKLVRCLVGEIYDVVVDIRVGSPTFGQWLGVELSSENGHQLFIPAGFAHGYLTLSDVCEVHYKVNAPYAAQAAKGIHFADPELGIIWPCDGNSPIVNVRDLALPLLSDFANNFVYDAKA